MRVLQLAMTWRRRMIHAKRISPHYKTILTLADPHCGSQLYTISYRDIRVGQIPRPLFWSLTLPTQNIAPKNCLWSQRLVALNLWFDRSRTSGKWCDSMSHFQAAQNLSATSRRVVVIGDQDQSPPNAYKPFINLNINLSDLAWRGHVTAASGPFAVAHSHQSISETAF